MARSIGIRRTLELLIKKVETLENQSFAQRLHIDELENKLSKAEEVVKQMKEDPLGIGKLVSVPSVWPATPLIANHTCIPSSPDTAGSIHCAVCGAYMTGLTWTVTSTAGNTQLCLADPAEQSSSDVEPTLDLDISWVIPDDK